MRRLEQPGPVDPGKSPPRREGPSLGLRLLVIAGWSVLIAVLLGTSNPPLPGSSETVPGWEAMLQLGHLVLFAVLGLLIASGALVAARSQRLSVALVAGLLVGGVAAALTEAYQLEVAGRSGNLEDILLDVTGAAWGALAAWMVRMWLIRRARGRRLAPAKAIGNASSIR